MVVSPLRHSDHPCHNITQHAAWPLHICPLQALSTLDKVVTDKLEDLSEITATPTSQLKFVTDAWSQVVDCRRMLKWTYAFGYYRFAEQSAASKPQQEFFEFNQVCAVPETLIAAVSHDSFARLGHCLLPAANTTGLICQQSFATFPASVLRLVS